MKQRLFMNSKAISALEYTKIISQLVNKASSPMGKEACRRLEPLTDLPRSEQAFPKRQCFFRKRKGYPQFSETSGRGQCPVCQ